MLVSPVLSHDNSKFIIHDFPPIQHFAAKETESGARYEIPTEVVLKIRVFCDFRLKQLNLLCEQTDGPNRGTSCY